MNTARQSYVNFFFLDFGRELIYICKNPRIHEHTIKDACLLLKGMVEVIHTLRPSRFSLTVSRETSRSNP